MQMNTRRLSRLSIFTAVALIIHTVEALLPLPLPIPGFKLGLANTVTLFMLFLPEPPEGARAATAGAQTPRSRTSRSRVADVLAVLLARILLSAFISGRLIILAYSLTGGLLAITAQLVARRFTTDKQAWVCGALGAVFHNIGQILAAIIVTGTPSIIGYLPVLTVTGIITGTLTGLLAGLAASRFSRKNYEKSQEL